MGELEPQLPDPLTPAEWETVIRALRLAPRQSRIVKAMLRGMGDKEIATAMKLSAATVRTHLRHLFRRLKINSRVELVLLAFSTARRGGVHQD